MSRWNLGWVIALGFPLLLNLGCNGSSQSGQDMGDPASTKIPGCIGSCKVNTSCPTSMGPTTVKGNVTIPAGTLPVYNATVYIPTGESLPPAPKTGASCERCDILKDSIASTTTDVNGNFTLTNIPSGENIPLIIKIGKWRKVVTLPAITDCTTTTLQAADTRLPRNKSEGNIPRIALSTGGFDALECILRNKKLGLDDAEFTTDAGDGRVHMYAGYGGASKFTPALGGMSFTAAKPEPESSWWDNLNNWLKYDIVILSCEGNTHMEYKSLQARQNLETFLNQGGRAYSSHFHFGWITNADASKQQIQKVVRDQSGPGGTDPEKASINTDFAKGRAFADWMLLDTVKGATREQIYMTDRVTFTIQGAVYSYITPAPKLTQTWVYFDRNEISKGSQYFSFYAPVGADPSVQCGQMVQTDVHIANGDYSSASTDFPLGCLTDTLSAQEKALIFLLFDLTGCVNPIIG